MKTEEGLLLLRFVGGMEGSISMSIIIDQHYALCYITPLFDMQAPTCFGIHVPSPGSFSCPRELVESRNVYVCLKVYNGYMN
jgi:hypothetical protein